MLVQNIVHMYLHWATERQQPPPMKYLAISDEWTFQSLSLDESSFIFKGQSNKFSFLFHLYEIPVSNQYNSSRRDAAFCGLYCLNNIKFEIILHDIS